MQKGTKKIFGWLNAFRLAAALERHPAEAEFLVLAFGKHQILKMCHKHFFGAAPKDLKTNTISTGCCLSAGAAGVSSARQEFLVTFFDKKVTKKYL